MFVEVGELLVFEESQSSFALSHPLPSLAAAHWAIIRYEAGSFVMISSDTASCEQLNKLASVTRGRPLTPLHMITS